MQVQPTSCCRADQHMQVGTDCVSELSALKHHTLALMYILQALGQSVGRWLRLLLQYKMHAGLPRPIRCSSQLLLLRMMSIEHCTVEEGRTLTQERSRSLTPVKHAWLDCIKIMLHLLASKPDPGHNRLCSADQHCTMAEQEVRWRRQQLPDGLLLQS